jgi:hypothetical protein
VHGHSFLVQIWLTPRNGSKGLVNFLIRVNRSNINFGIVSKLEELGDGLHVSCRVSAGFDLATTIVLIGNKLFLKKGFPKSMVRRYKYGISFGGLPFGPSGSNIMTR